MLKSFVGTFDSGGLRSFRSEDAALSDRVRDAFAPESFWAIIDSKDLPPILQAAMLGQRGTALELIAQQAVSFGRFAN